MNHFRRRFLGLLGALPWFSVCATRAVASPLSKKIKELPMQAISPEEIELLKNPLARPAYFASKGLPQGVLEIRQRVFGETRMLLRGADIKDVRFVNCVFELFQGYDNNLKNVVFEECQFLGSVFTGDEWKNVKLIRCKAEGPFKIGCADGDVSFEDCKLQGMTAKEGGYGNWSDHFGIATATDGAISFLRCKLENLSSSGAKKLQLFDCEIADLNSNCRSKRGVLHVENCRAKGKMDLGGGNDFSRITIKSSQLGKVDLMSASAQIFEIDNSIMSLKMGSVSAKFDTIVMRNVNFFDEGFRCVLARFGTLLLDQCTFDKASKGLQLFGDTNTDPLPGEYPFYWTRTRHLTLRNMVVPKAQMAYMQVGTLTLDNATLENADLSHGCFGTVQFKNARLGGTLNLTDTTIRRIENNGLSNSAQITGKLEANPAAPEPDLAALDQPPGRPMRVPNDPNKRTH